MATILGHGTMALLIIMAMIIEPTVQVNDVPALLGTDHLIGLGMALESARCPEWDGEHLSW